MMIYKLILPLTLILSLSGCCDRPKPCPSPKVVNLTTVKVKEVYKEVATYIDMPDCNLSGSGYQPTIQVLKCIITLKETIRNHNNAVTKYNTTVDR